VAVTEAGGTWTLAAIILAAAAVSDFWRMLGAMVSARIDESSPAYTLVKCVATALIAAIIAKLVLYPTGLLGEIPLWLRIGAMAAGFAAYLATRRSMVMGTIVCTAVLATGVAWTA
jgi:branched-subunit amino acid transport protein